MTQENFRFVQADTDVQSISEYANLLQMCFPGATHLNKDNIKWQYIDNPAGKLVGYNAYSGNTLAAHYACIPTEVVLHGQRTLALLSLNTATHPDYQGNGLFKKLARKTFTLAESLDFSCVIGVANQNSTHGFVKSMDFQLVAPLEAKIGFSDLNVDWGTCADKADFYCHWNRDSIDWRQRTPKKNMQCFIKSPNRVYGSAKIGIPGVQVSNPIYFPDGDSPTEPTRGPASLKLFLGLFPKDTVSFRGYFDIPEFIKPSPLNLIYKALKSPIASLDPDKILFGFQDFDAY